jgi:DNA-binding XRE family transcriptional regulator
VRLRRFLFGLSYSRILEYRAQKEAAMTTRMLLGQRIAEERKRAGLTQAQLAVAVGLERTAITRMEQGRQDVDTLQLAAIAVVFDTTSPHYFTATGHKHLLERPMAIGAPSQIRPCVCLTPSCFV